MKQLHFTYKDKEYTLEFTRKSVEQMERNGFVADDILNKPVIAIPALFAGAFIANHPFTRKDTIEQIYNSINNRRELISRLVEMYNEPISALIDEPEEDEGNADWTASW